MAHGFHASPRQEQAFAPGALFNMTLLIGVALALTVLIHTRPPPEPMRCTLRDEPVRGYPDLLEIRDHDSFYYNGQHLTDQTELEEKLAQNAGGGKGNAIVLSAMESASYKTFANVIRTIRCKTPKMSLHIDHAGQIQVSLGF